MLNEGIIVNDSTALIKSEMINQIRTLGHTTPNELERAVFKSVSGHDRDEVDWDIEDNQAGYFTWLQSFDQLLSEVIEDGYILVEEAEDGEGRTLVPAEVEPHSEYSFLVYPPPPSS